MAKQSASREAPITRRSSQNAGLWLIGFVFSLALAGLGWLGWSGSQPFYRLKPYPAALPAEGLAVDANHRLGRISPYVYGANYGPWMHLPPGQLVQQAGLTFLRFPGGNWGDENSLTHQQIAQFIKLAREMGAEPSISVRLKDGSPEAAAALVSYTNLVRGFNVRYWSIGNEPSLYPNYNTERFNKDWRAFALAMRAVDPTIQLIGPEIHQFPPDPAAEPHDSAGRNWLREFLLTNGDLVDIVSIHRYPFPTSETAPPLTIDALQVNSREWDSIIPRLRAVIQETVGRDLPIAVTELNSHWSAATGGEATPDSHYSAIWWGDVLGRLIQQRVAIAAYFALQFDTTNGGWGLINERQPSPTYYVYQMYQRFGQTLVYARSDDADVSIYAALRDDGTLTLMIVNLSSDEKIKPLQVEGFSAGLADLWRLDTSHPAENVGQQTMRSGEKITLPAQSVSLYIFNTASPRLISTRP